MNDQENPPQVPYLAVSSHGTTTWIDLDRDTNTLVGTGSHCKVQLEGGSGVRSLHCILAFKEGGHLEVRDWNTGSTLVNGLVVHEATELKEVDVLTVGDYQIQAVLSETTTPATVEVEQVRSELEQASPEVGVEPASKPVVVEVVDGHELVVAASSPAVEMVSEHQPTIQPEDLPQQHNEAAPEVVVEPEAIVENSATPNTELEPNPQPMPTVESEVEVESEIEDECEVLVACELQQEPLPPEAPLEFVYDIDADFEDETDDVPAGFEAPQFTDGFSNTDELQLLRSENDQLRAELVDLKNRDSTVTRDPELLNREQTMQLVSRLEQVLDELKRSDARADEMSDRLQAADQAKQDEQEEREHIEKWLTQLENRVEQRESGTQAEVEDLKARLAEARTIQQKSNECLESVLAAKTGDGVSVPVELARDLTNHIESLQAQLNSSQAETVSLRQQLEERPAGLANEDVLRESEQKLAKLELEVSHERAEISRQWTELNRLKGKLETQLDPEEVNSATQEESACDSLANRISDLLQRVAVE